MTTISDKCTQETQHLIDALPRMTDSELWDAQTHAAEDFAAYTLHAKLPTEEQGATDNFAQRLRAQRASAAEALWLAVQAERASRRNAAILTRALTEAGR